MLLVKHYTIKTNIIKYNLLLNSQSLNQKYKYISYLPTPPLGHDMKQGQF